jgi:glycosyltransferase involved in cell wall biosynthesis
MRILFVLPSFPFPPGDGGRAKLFNILKFLSERHECDLICFGESDREDVAGLRRILPLVGKVWIVRPPSWISKILGTFANLMCLRPPSFARYSSNEMANRIEAETRHRGYDAVHFDIINMAPYQRYCRDLPSVHSPNDATSLVYSRLSDDAPSMVTRLRLRAASFLLARYERKKYADFSKIHVVSDQDRDYLSLLRPDADIEVVPITSGYSKDIAATIPVREASRNLVVTVCGNLGDTAIAEGFRDFLKYVLPAVSAAQKGLQVRVLGRRLGASLLRELQKQPNVEHFAWVDDFKEFLLASDVLLLPDRAGAPGPKTRTVQAMALGRSVLGSTTAFEGIRMINGYHGACYTTQEECRDLLLRLLGDSVLRVSMGIAAAKLAADEYSIESVGPQYEALYIRALQSHGAREDSSVFSRRGIQK